LADPVTSASRESFTFKLAPGDIELFRLYATAERHYVEWTASLHYLVDGVRKSIELDNGGGPFKTTGISPTKRVVDSIGDGRWERATPSPEPHLGNRWNCWIGCPPAVSARLLLFVQLDSRVRRPRRSRFCLNAVAPAPLL
jgi:hypothetical protein